MVKNRYKKFLKLWMARVKLRKEVVKIGPWIYIDIYLEKIWVAVLYESGKYVTLDQIPSGLQQINHNLRYCIELLMESGLKERIYET